jgi:GDP-L-fucose synthase
MAAKTAGLLYNAEHHESMFAANLLPLAGLPYCFATKPRGLIYFSTACVYPTEAPVPTSEAYGDQSLPEVTNRGYGLAKRTGETAALDLGSSYGVPVCVVRLFNTYGLWDNFDLQCSHVVPAILGKMMRRDSRLEVIGGSQTRAFVFVEDVVRICLRLCMQLTDSFTVNIGHSREITIERAVQIASQATQYPGEIRYMDGPIGYYRRAADESRLRSKIGDIQWTSFQDGVNRTVEWLKTKDGEDWIKHGTTSR